MRIKETNILHVSAIHPRIYLLFNSEMINPCKSEMFLFPCELRACDNLLARPAPSGVTHNGHDTSPGCKWKGSSQVLDFPVTVISALANSKHHAFLKVFLMFCLAGAWRTLGSDRFPGG